MRLGIGSYTYTWEAGVPGHSPGKPLRPMALLERAGALGVGVVQFCDNLPIHCLPPDELDALVGFAKGHGISLELGWRGLLDTESLLANVRLAQRVGSPFLRLVVDSKDHEPSPEEVISRLEALMPRFDDAGVKLALENHDRFACRTLVEIVEQLGTGRAGICLDTVNSFGALEGPEMVVRTLAPYALNLHVKDFTITRVPSQMGYTVSGCPAGRGRLDVPWLLAALGGTGREISAIIELWTPYGPDLPATLERESTWAVESVRALRQFVPD